MPSQLKPIKVYPSPQLRQKITTQAQQLNISTSQLINQIIETHLNYTSIKKTILMTYKDLSDLAQQLEPNHRQRLSQIAINLLKCLT